MTNKVDEQTAERESAVTHTIGIEALAFLPGEDEGRIAVVRRERDGDKLTVRVLEDYAVAAYPHPLGMLSDALDDLDHFASDADEPTPTIEPLSGAVLAAIGQPLYTAPLDLRVDHIDAPSGGPYWQIRDAIDETRWHDVTAVVDCELDACDVFGCTVLVSSAYRQGFAHWPSTEVLSVRIPAVSA